MDFSRARAETPGAARLAHLNNAGAALPPAVVTDAVVGYLRAEAMTGGYELAEAEAERVEHTYDALARLVGCSRDEIAILESATAAWGGAFHAFDLRPGDKILTGRGEYASNAIAHRQVAERTGAAIEFVDADEHGRLDVADLRRRIDERVKLISITHVGTQGGPVNPVAEVGAVARAAGVPYLLDACQSAGQLDLDVEAIGCDLLSATGRKFLRAPRGTGFLYVRRGLELRPPMLDDHAAAWTGSGYEVREDARRFENFERNIAAVIGLGVAADYALSWGTDAIEARVTELAARLRELLTERGAVVHESGPRLSAIVTFSLPGYEAEEVRRVLAAEGVQVWVTHAFDAPLDLPARGLRAVVRASPHYYNDEEDLDRLISALPQ